MKSSDSGPASKTMTRPRMKCRVEGAGGWGRSEMLQAAQRIGRAGDTVEEQIRRDISRSVIIKGLTCVPDRGLYDAMGRFFKTPY